MKGMDKLTEIRCPIEAELERYGQLFEDSLHSGNPLLQTALNHVMRRRGKLMRPILTLLAAKYVGSIGEGVLHAAVALEMLHTASLVHDDIIDHSDRRRGQASVNALIGNHAAVLVGDFLLSKGIYHAACIGSAQVVRWVAELGQDLSDGELLQLANLDKTEISEADYYDVIGKKTASLFETCAKAGALLAGGSEEDVRRMADFGHRVGLCFQLRDDLLDYDHQHDTGKPSGNDMQEGKLTLPVIRALLSSGDEAMRQIALKVRRGAATDEEIGLLVRFTHEQGGLSESMKVLDRMGKDALAAIVRTEDNAPVADALCQYVRFVVGRDI